MIASMGPATDATPPPVITISDAAINAEPTLAIDEEVVPPSSIGSAPMAVDGSSVAAAIPVAESIGATLDNEVGAITDGPIINRFKRARSFYGPNIDPGTAFNASGSIDKGAVADDAASMKSAASNIKKRASPKRGGGGDSAANKKRTIDSSAMPLVKPKTMRSSCKAISTLALLVVGENY